MSELTILGIGPMGSALALALRRAGRTLTLWNRTRARAEAHRGDGVQVATSAAAAVAAAPIVLVCVTDYAASLDVLAAADLTDKVLVQLSTGTPQEARDAEAWATGRGASYLDGAILAVPGQIGAPEATIFVSGAPAAFAASEAPLRQLAGIVQYLGAAVGAASALDLAFLSHLFGGLLGFYHGARICEAEGLSVGGLGAMLAAVAPAIGGMVAHDAGRIESGHYTDPESSLATCARGTDLILRHSREAGLDPQIAGLAAAVFDRGRRAGLGERSPAALVELLRQGGAR